MSFFKHLFFPAKPAAPLAAKPAPTVAAVSDRRPAAPAPKPLVALDPLAEGIANCKLALYHIAAAKGYAEGPDVRNAHDLIAVTQAAREAAYEAGKAAGFIEAALAYLESIKR
jgi:hypothetical protein